MSIFKIPKFYFAQTSIFNRFNLEMHILCFTVFKCIFDGLKYKILKHIYLSELKLSLIICIFLRLYTKYH